MGVYTSIEGLEKTIINISDYIVSQVNARLGQSGTVKKLFTCSVILKTFEEYLNIFICLLFFFIYLDTNRLRKIVT